MRVAAAVTVVAAVTVALFSFLRPTRTNVLPDVKFTSEPMLLHSDGRVDVSVPIPNPLDEAVELRIVGTSCSCLSAEIEPRVVEGGETAKATVTASLTNFRQRLQTFTLLVESRRLGRDKTDTELFNVIAELNVRPVLELSEIPDSVKLKTADDTVEIEANVVNRGSLDDLSVQADDTEIDIHSVAAGAGDEREFPEKSYRCVIRFSPPPGQDSGVKKIRVTSGRSLLVHHLRWRRPKPLRTSPRRVFFKPATGRDTLTFHVLAESACQILDCSVDGEVSGVVVEHSDSKEKKHTVKVKFCEPVDTGLIRLSVQTDMSQAAPYVVPIYLLGSD